MSRVMWLNNNGGGGEDSHVLSIKTLQKRRTCIQVFSCINGNVCNNFEGYFNVMENNTRNAKKLLRLLSVKLESTKKSFKFTGAKLYNELPIEVRSATSAKNVCIII